MKTLPIIVLGAILGSMLAGCSSSPVVSKVDSDSTKVVYAKVGDVIQIQPFTYALVPKNINNEIWLEVSDEGVADLVGTIENPPRGDGLARPSAFLYAKKPGSAQIRAWLAGRGKDELDKPVEIKIYVTPDRSGE
jgi:signal peptidase I